MTRAGIRSGALVLLVLTLPLPYYAPGVGMGVVPWLVLALLPLFPFSYEHKALSLTVIAVQLAGYAVLLWVIASYAASRLVTMSSRTRVASAFVLAWVLTAAAWLPIYRGAGADSPPGPAIFLLIGAAVFLFAG